MPKAAFALLVSDVAVPMASIHRGYGHRIPANVSFEVQVSSTLRWLAGGSYLDIVDMHGISETTFYHCNRAFVMALINHPRHKINFPYKDEVELGNIARGWSQLDKTQSFPGCVGALDGLIVAITKPWVADTTNPAQYKNRKGMFAMIAQARTALQIRAAIARVRVPLPFTPLSSARVRSRTHVRTRHACACGPCVTRACGYTKAPYLRTRPRVR